MKKGLTIRRNGNTVLFHDTRLPEGEDVVYSFMRGGPDGVRFAKEAADKLQDALQARIDGDDELPILDKTQEDEFGNFIRDLINEYEELHDTVFQIDDAVSDEDENEDENEVEDENEENEVDEEKDG